MSRERTDSILKVLVKHFFIEKEVTSTLVMDSLYSGMRALEYHIESKKAGVRHSDAEEFPVPIVRVENNTFILVDDVLLLLERAAMEPLPPKDEKGPQNRTKVSNVICLAKCFNFHEFHSLEFSLESKCILQPQVIMHVCMQVSMSVVYAMF